MATSTQNSPHLVDAFNQAAALARQGQLDASLNAWNWLIDTPHPGAYVTGDFLGVAHMRRAWVLMDMNRHHEARECFESGAVQACLGQLGLQNLYEYFFSYGNTLGQLGDLAAMDDAFSRALGIAANELGDLARCERVWENLMVYAHQWQAWSYLERECTTAVEFADNTGARALAFQARWNRAQALGALGRRRKARREADKLLAMARVAGAHDAAWQIESFRSQLA